MAVHRPARLPAKKVEAARQDCSARPPWSRDAAGRRSAADSSPARRVEKYQPSARGGGAPRGGKVQTAKPRRTKMVPPRLGARRGSCPRAPPQLILVLHPLRYPKCEEWGARGLFCFSSSLSGRSQALRALLSCARTPGAQLPVSRICNSSARNPSFRARGPHTGKCLCGTERTQRGQTGLTGVPSREGENSRSLASRGGEGLFTRARPCPRAHSSTGIRLASASPGWPLLCPERKLMQYRSPIIKCSWPVFPNCGLYIPEASTHLRCSQIPEPLDLIFL